MSELKKEFLDVVQAVLPIAGVVLLLQIFLISMPWIEFARFVLGVLLVMAGLLETQVPSLAEAFAPFLRLEAVDQVGEWVCLAGRRD